MHDYITTSHLILNPFFKVGTGCYTFTLRKIFYSGETLFNGGGQVKNQHPFPFQPYYAPCQRKGDILTKQRFQSRGNIVTDSQLNTSKVA